METYLEGLLSRFIRGLVNDDVVLCPRKMLVQGRIKGTLSPVSWYLITSLRWLTHSQLMAMSTFPSIPRDLSLGVSLTCSIYAALHPVPKIQAILVVGST